MAPASFCRRPAAVGPLVSSLAALLAACVPALRPLPAATPIVGLAAPVDTTPAVPVDTTPAVPPVPAPSPSPAMPRPPAGVSLEDLEYLRGRELMVPVSGVAPADVTDTFNEPRGRNRIHRAVDILAKRGTPVLSTDSGRVYRMRRNARGGITIYAVDPSERFVYYYAHLQRYRDGLHEGAPVAKGEVLGYVGSTGNASPDEPHLHFQLMRMRDARRWWDGIPVDPRPYFALSGTEFMALTGKERAELRSEAHHLTPLVHVGQQGITPNVVQALDDALRTRELVKVQLTRAAEASARDAARDLAAATGAEVVQTIGKTATLYRENPELPKQKGEVPPWKR